MTLHEDLDLTNVHLIDHPLVQHKLTLMRNKEASTNRFRRLLHELSMLMAYEVTRDMAMQQFPMGCVSGAQDGQETDVDCGGEECQPCAVGKMCKLGRDCESMFCTNNVCDAASCSDMVKNGDEMPTAAFMSAT